MNEKAKESILILPALFEERKNCLNLINDLISKLSLKYTILRLDFTATGESTGDFSNVDFNDWQENIKQGIDFLKTEFRQPISILAFRLAANLSLSSAELVKSACLLNPILSGENYLQEMLRRKQIKEMMASGKAKSEPEALIEQWQSGQTLDIDSYLISAQLYEDIKAINLSHDFNDISLKSTIFHSAGAKAADAKWLAFSESLKQNQNFYYLRQKPYWERLEYHYFTDLIDIVCSFFEVNIAD